MSNLTGKTRFRPYVTDDGVRLMLQIEFVEHTALPHGIGMFAHREWRDATVEDLCEVQHLTYRNIQLQAVVRLLDVSETLPGEENHNARKLH